MIGRCFAGGLSARESLAPVLGAGILLASLIFSPAANADIITINASDYLTGTDVSAAIEGVSLSRVSSNEGDFSFASSGVGVTDCLGSDYCGTYGGTQEFGGNYANALYAGRCVTLGSGCWEWFSALVLTFDSPTRSIGLQGHQYSDPASVAVLTTSGELYSCDTANYFSSSTCTWTAVGGGYSGQDYWTLQIQHDERDIAQVWFGAVWGAARVGQISVSVPEPATLALLVLGLFGMRFSKPRLV